MIKKSKRIAKKNEAAQQPSLADQPAQGAKRSLRSNQKPKTAAQQPSLSAAQQPSVSAGQQSSVSAAQQLSDSGSMKIENSQNPVAQQPVKAKKFDRASLKREGSAVEIQIGERKYTFDVSDAHTAGKQALLDVIADFESYVPLLDGKQLQKDDKVLQVTDHYQYSALEYFLFKSEETIQCEKQKLKVQEDKCTICQFELYEDINDYDKAKFVAQLTNSANEDCLGLSNCQNHYFHRECLLMCITSSFIRCPVCYQIYGVMVGDQPDGTMTHRVEKNTQCSGYTCGTIVINYSFPSGIQKNGVRYSGTRRVAYLPNNAEGREVLELLKVGFQRKLLFTIGRSVTTGEDNTTVWNGVHHKTNTHGGATSFGWPDPTYCDRVKLELAMKGVLPQ